MEPNRFYITNYENEKLNEWNSFVYNNKLGYVLHLYEVNSVDEDSSNTNLSFSIRDRIDNSILMLFPIFYCSQNNELISRSGFIYRDFLPKHLFIKLTEFCNYYLDNLIKQYRIKKFDIEMPTLNEYNLNQNGLSLNPAIFFGFKPKIRYSNVVNLKKSTAELLSNCEETTRQAIRKFIFNDEFMFIESTRETLTKDLKTFITLSNTTYSRSGSKAKSDAYYNNIFLKVNSQARRIFFIKDNNGNALVSALVFIHKNTAQYALGASLTNKPIGLSKFLIYRIMVELQKCGIEYFEVGGYYPYFKQGNKLRGIGDFKKSFGASLFAINMGEYCI